MNIWIFLPKQSSLKGFIGVYESVALYCRLGKKIAKCFVIQRKSVPLQAEYYQICTKGLVFSILLFHVSGAFMRSAESCFLSY